MKLTTYLNFGGNCAEALQFYAEHLGAKILHTMKYSDAPDQSAPQANPDSVLFARFVLGNVEVMASDVPAERFQRIRSVYLALSVDSDTEAERIYALLTDGGEVYMPMQETFFATRYGQFRDRFGVSWMVIHERPMGPPA